MKTLVPSFIVQNQMNGRYSGELTAVAIQIDLSGFTQLTNTIMDQDRDSGGEIVANLIRDAFSPLIDLVEKQNGFVGMFAGDAFTAFFPIAHEPKEKVLHRALTTVWQMSQYIEFTRFSPPFTEVQFQFKIKIGMGLGQIFWRIFPTPDDGHQAHETRRTVYSFNGEGLTQAITAVNMSRTDDVTLSTNLAHQLLEFIDITPHPDSADFSLVVALKKAIPPSAANQFGQIIDVPPEAARPFVPQALQDKAAEGEFRQVVSLFIGVHTPLETLDQLAPLVNLIYELQLTYGGYLNAVRFGDKGVVLVMFWGAPTALEQSTFRASNFAHVLNLRSPYTLRLGLSYRWLYAGLIGSDTRQDYTCYGGGTSFSARLMVAAEPKQILLDEAIASRINSLYWLTQLGQQNIKGFDEPQMVYQLDQPKDLEAAFDYEQPFVGRETETEQIHAFIKPLFDFDDDSFIGTYLIRGEAGSGKSRLLYEVRQQVAEQYPNEFLWYEAQADELVQTDLNPIRYFLQHYFDQSPEAADEQNKLRFTQQFNSLLDALDNQVLSAELERTRSFLAALLGLYWPDSPYQRVNAQLRQENLHNGLFAFFQALTEKSRIILQIEDIHWVDSATIQFLDRLLDELSESDSSHHLALLITTRNLGDIENELMLKPVSHSQTFSIGALDDQDIALFAQNLTKKPLASKFIRFLKERTDGNPFFIEQTILYLIEMGQLIEEGESITVDSSSSLISADMRMVVLARIDRLLPDVQNTVQTAAVLGREFSLNILRHMLAQNEQLDNHVRLASESVIWVQLQELRYLFKHAILRDIAYQMQLQSRRQQLHRLAFEAILALYQANLDPYYGELAYHAEQANLIDEAITYLEKAGKYAYDNYQNESALNFYSRGYALLDQASPNLSESIKFQFFTKRTFAQCRLLNYENALETYHEGIRFAHQQQNLNFVMEMFFSLAHICYVLGNYHLGISGLCFVIDHYKPRIKIDSDATQQYIYALNRLSALYAHQGWVKMSLPPLLEAQDLLMSLPEKTTMHGQIQYDLGFSKLYLSDLQGALSHLEQAHAVFEELKNDREICQTLDCVGYIHSQLGNYHLSIDYYENAYKRAKKLNFHSKFIQILGNWGYASYRIGQYEAAEDLLNRAMQLAKKAASISAQCWLSRDFSDLYATLGRIGDAFQTNQDFLELANKINHKTYKFQASMQRASLLYENQQSPDALNVINQIDPTALSDSHQADWYYMRWRIQRKNGDAKQALIYYKKVIGGAPKKDWLARVSELENMIVQ